jgi:hypothetical protein
LAGTAWGEQIRAAGVASFYRVWVGDPKDGCGGFYVEYGNSVERVIFPRRKCAEEKFVGCIDWKK